MRYLEINSALIHYISKADHAEDEIKSISPTVRAAGHFHATLISTALTLDPRAPGTPIEQYVCVWK